MPRGAVKTSVTVSIDEATTIGIVLCSEKNDAMVKITLPKDNAHILAASYQVYLPTEEELRALRVTKDPDDGQN